MIGELATLSWRSMIPWNCLSLHPRTLVTLRLLCKTTSFLSLSSFATTRAHLPVYKSKAQMLSLSLLIRYTVSAPRGLHFTLSASEAIDRIKQEYGGHLLGAKLDDLHLQTPSKEFLPFYLCRGTVNGTFHGTATYTTWNSAKDGKSSNSTMSVRTSPQNFSSIFEYNQTQIYAGYKYNMDYVHHTLRDESLAILPRKMQELDTAGATINLFEQSTTTMQEFVQLEVEKQANNAAAKTVHSYHASADAVSVEFTSLNIHIEEVTPVFVPCYVIKVSYNEEEYTLFVSGSNGKVGGPRLLYPTSTARLASGASMVAVFLTTANKFAGLILGSAAAITMYYLVFYAARAFPKYHSRWLHSKQEKLRVKNKGGDATGFKPSPFSKRSQEEYRRSSYWDSHAFQQRARQYQSDERSSSGSNNGDSKSSSSSDSNHFRSAGATPEGTGPVVKDRKGYYQILGLRGDESVNEIRSSYRKLVLKQHPDAGGSDEHMANINEAYRVLRHPERRKAYDRS